MLGWIAWLGLLAGPRAPPDGFVDLREALPGACFVDGYAAADNFTGAALPGYGVAGAWLLRGPAEALGRVQAAIINEGYVLLIFDAYRPVRASEAMLAWARRTGQTRLISGGYIASRSNHNHGHTVDLGLARVGTCEKVDMGTEWDTLDERSHTLRASGAARVERLRLRAAMRAAGFADYPREWWHFTYRHTGGTRPLDVAYSLRER